VPSRVSFTSDQRALIKRADVGVLALDSPEAYRIDVGVQRLDSRPPGDLISVHLDYRAAADTDPDAIVHSYARKLLLQVHGSERIGQYLGGEARRALATRTAALSAERPRDAHREYQRILDDLPGAHLVEVLIDDHPAPAWTIPGPAGWSVTWTTESCATTALVMLFTGPQPRLVTLDLTTD